MNFLPVLQKIKNVKLNFLPALQLLFVALKLTKFIDWSWWLVLLPTIIQIGIIGVLLLILLILCLINNFLK